MLPTQFCSPFWACCTLLEFLFLYRFGPLLWHIWYLPRMVTTSWHDAYVCLCQSLSVSVFYDRQHLGEAGLQLLENVWWLTEWTCGCTWGCNVWWLTEWTCGCTWGCNDVRSQKLIHGSDLRYTLPRMTMHLAGHIYIHAACMYTWTACVQLR